MGMRAARQARASGGRRARAPPGAVQAGGVRVGDGGVCNRRASRISSGVFIPRRRINTGGAVAVVGSGVAIRRVPGRSVSLESVRCCRTERTSMSRLA